MASWAHQLIEEGLQRGRALGLHQGRAEQLIRILGRRFGELPADARAKVEAADDETLNRWTDELFLASSLDELFQR